MSFSLSKHTLPELETLLVEIKQEIAARESAALTPAEPSAVEAVTEAAPAPSGEAPQPEQVEAGVAAPVIRYVHPASRTLTWTGEGPTPEWLTAYLAHGGSWSAMENAAEKLAASHRMSARLFSAASKNPSGKR